jgi:hypothetical protein
VIEIGQYQTDQVDVVDECVEGLHLELRNTGANDGLPLDNPMKTVGAPIRLALQVSTCIGEIERLMLNCTTLSKKLSHTKLLQLEESCQSPVHTSFENRCHSREVGPLFYDVAS